MHASTAEPHLTTEAQRATLPANPLAMRTDSKTNHRRQSAETHRKSPTHAARACTAGNQVADIPSS